MGGEGLLVDDMSGGWPPDDGGHGLAGVTCSNDAGGDHVPAAGQDSGGEAGGGRTGLDDVARGHADHCREIVSFVNVLLKFGMNCIKVY